jgi:hypothetical protein
LSDRQCKPTAIVVYMAFFQVGLGGGRSRALGGGMGPVASFYFN